MAQENEEPRQETTTPATEPTPTENSPAQGQPHETTTPPPGATTTPPVERTDFTGLADNAYADSIRVADQYASELNERRTSPEDRKREERRLRCQRIMAGVATAGSQIANMIGTAMGGMNTQSPETNSVSRVDEAYQKYRDRLKQEDREYYETALAAAGLRTAREQMRHNLDMAGRAEGRAEDTLNIQRDANQRAADMHPSAVRMAGLQADNEATRGEILRTEAQYKGDQLRAGIAAQNAQTAHSNAAAQELGGGERTSGFPWWDRDGNQHFARTQEEAIANATAHNTVQYRVETITEQVPDLGSPGGTAEHTRTQSVPYTTFPVRSPQN